MAPCRRTRLWLDYTGKAPPSLCTKECEKGCCLNCGWNPMEIQRRRDLIKIEGLQLLRNDLRGLQVQIWREDKKNGNESEINP